MENTSFSKTALFRKAMLMLLSIVSMHVNGQTASPDLILAKGMTFEYEIVSYPIPLTALGVKWIKMKPEKKAETVIKYNEDVKAGVIKPTGKVSQFARINDVAETSGIIQFIGTTQINNKLTIINGNDSVYYLQNDGKPFPIIKDQKDTIGINYYGIRRFPAKLEVGTMLPGFTSEMNLFPYDLKTSRREYFNFSGGDGYSYSGFVNVRKTRTMQVNSISISTPFYVAGMEEIEISGKKYTVYKLLNEQWSKISSNAMVQDDPTVYFGDKYLSDKVKDHLEARGRGWDTPERTAKIQAKMEAATGMTKNEQGYLVNVQENWYSPLLGMIVKSKLYDGSGALQMESNIVSIK